MLLIPILVACASAKPHVQKIVISYDCGRLCAYQIVLMADGTYSWDDLYHRSAFKGRFNGFKAVESQLRRLRLFERAIAAPRGHEADTQSRTFFALLSDGSSMQADFVPGEAGYRRFARVAEAVATPIQRDVSKTRAREALAREPKDLVAVSVTQANIGRCVLFDANFNAIGMTTVYAFGNPRGPLRKKAIHIAMRFENVRRLVRKDHLAFLYEHYPTAGSDFSQTQIRLLYKKSAYTIVGYERRYWPSDLINFIDSINDLISSSAEHGHATLPC